MRSKSFRRRGIAGDFDADRLAGGELGEVAIKREATVEGRRFDLHGIDVKQAGKVVGRRSRTGCGRGRSLLPDPEQVVEAVVPGEAVEEHAVELRGAAWAFAAGPPVGFIGCIGVGIEEDGDVGFLKFAECFGGGIDLCSPELVQSRAWSDEVVPFVVGESGSAYAVV